MELTTRGLARFTGGHMEVENEREGYVYHGEIATIVVDDEEQVVVTFNWLARAEGYPPFRTDWVREDLQEYVVQLGVSAVTTLGPCGRDSMVRFESWVTGDTVILFPPGCNKSLDSALVKGLKTAAAN